MALAGGAALSAHCLGMCGPFVLHLAGAQPGAAAGGFVRQLLWHLGRITTYVFLGALAGAAGTMILKLPWPWAPDALAYLAGGGMVLIGLALLGVLPVRRWKAGPVGQGLLARVLGQFFSRPTPAAALTLGLATGFLPCPAVLGFLTLSAGSGSTWEGMTIMAAMGVGASWTLVLLGFTGQLVRQRLRRWGPAVGGAIVVLLGIATILRPSLELHGLFGCSAGCENAPAPSPTSMPACCSRPAPEEGH
jgi:sulfite exporter TauE/SafE